ncbi:MAG: hypothetical protein ABIW57_01375 [Polyangia bacterium]
MKSIFEHIASRYLLLLVPTIVVSGTGSASAEAPTPERASIATSVVTPFFGAYYLEGKLRALHSVAVVVNASYLTLANDGWTSRAGTAGFGVDYFFRGNALRGWYAEAIGEVWLTSRRHEASREVAPTGYGYAGVALAGYQFVWRRGPVLDLGAGVVAFHVPKAAVELGGEFVRSASVNRIYPAAKVNIGWAF